MKVELSKLRAEYKSANMKLAELNEDELKKVIGCSGFDSGFTKNTFFDVTAVRQSVKVNEVLTVKPSSKTVETKFEVVT